jgi:superfamily II DNA/RNA helicase
MRRFAVQAMVLCPTRELADQVTQEIRRLARAEDNIKMLSLVGGSTMRAQAPAWSTARTSSSAPRDASWTTCNAKA